MELTIRPITVEDNAEIAAIIRAALKEFGADRPGTVYYDDTTDHLFELFQEQGSTYFIAESGNRIIGGAGIYPTKGLPAGCCELVKMYLSPDARGKGLGKQLISLCLRTAADLGYSHVYLETMPELKKALSVYEKFGFKYLEGPLGDSGHFGCGMWMLLDLSRDYFVKTAEEI
jgi:putative acetyltransferase